MRNVKAIDCACGLSGVIVGLGLYSYYVRELLASLLLFSSIFILFGLVVLAGFLLWCVSKQVALWTGPASRNAIIFSRRVIAAYSKS